MLGVALGLTVLALAFTVFACIGNGGSLRSDREQGGSWWLVVAWVIVIMAWLSAWGLSSVNAAELRVPPPLAIGVTPLPATKSILPPGMRSISVTLTKVRPREESRRAFIRRLLSPKGKGRLE